MEQHLIEIDPQSGRVTRFGWADETQSVASSCFCEPFVHGTDSTEEVVVCPADGQGTYRSFSGATSLRYRLGPDRIDLWAQLPVRSGPRVGLRMDLNFLDADPQVPRDRQFMPHAIYTDEDRQYAYFVFRRMDGRFVWLTVNSPFAAWRFRYSYSGHRILGLDLLSTAQDVLKPDGSPLGSYDRLAVAFGLAQTLEKAWGQVADSLGIVIPLAPALGGVVGSSLNLRLVGPQQGVLFTLVPPGTGGATSTELSGGSLTLVLSQPGTFLIHGDGPNGRRHTSRLLALCSWKELFHQVNTFSADHFQLPSGAFARVIRQDSLAPDGMTMEGVAFGDDTKMVSCRTGEFGGFAAWAMIKNLGLFGTNPRLEASVRRYLDGWALHRSEPDRKSFGTVYPHPQEFLGKTYSAGHLYHELNYPQYEAFLVEQLCDWFLVSGDEAALASAVALGSHMIADHVGPEGAIWCQNNVADKPVDYSTVHTPLLAFVRLHRCLQDRASDQAAFFLETAERMADHLVQRGAVFPTEGEPCTEDGSMSCTVISLATAWLEVAPKQAYLDLAKKISEIHETLTLKGADVRLHGSSLRFWETQYETDDWGPSINAGHAWTMWTVEADYLLARATRSFSKLEAAWAGTLCVASKVRENGAMPSCYTPDPIPGLPHHPFFLLFDENSIPEMENATETKGGQESILADARITTSVLAQDYPRRTYSCSGNYLLIKAAEIWDHAAGFDGPTRVVNGRFEGTHFVPATAHLTRLFVGAWPDHPVTLRLRPGQVIEVVVDPSMGPSRTVTAGAEGLVTISP